MRSYKRGVVLILILLALPAVSNAVLVQQVQVTQATGAYAHYESDTGEVTWSSGAGGWLMTDNFGMVSFTNASVTGNFSGISDVSANNLAEAMPEKAAELRAKLRNWRLEVDAQMNQLNPSYNPDVGI